MSTENTSYNVGSRLQLKKAHPCGGSVFLVERLGMDCRLKCEKCGARISLLRRDLNKRIKKIADDNNTVDN